MVKFIKYLGSTVLCLFVIALIIPYFISLNTYKAEIQDKVKIMTGRDLGLDGDIKFRILPRPYLKLKQVKLGSIPNTKTKHLADVESIEVLVSILPLLKGMVKIEEVALNEPKFYFETTKQGQNNWDIKLTDLDSPSEPISNLDAQQHQNQNSTSLSPVSSQSNENASLESTSSENTSSFAIDIAKVRVNGGYFSYEDPKTDFQLSDLDVTMTFDSLSGPFDIYLSTMWEKQPLKVYGRVDAFTDTIPVDMTVEFLGKKLLLVGNVNPKTFAYTMQVDINGRLSGLKTLYPKLTVPDGLRNPYSLSASLEGDASLISINELKFVSGPITANGGAHVDLKKLTGSFKAKVMPGDIDVSIKPTTTGSDNFSGYLSLQSKQTKAFLQAVGVPIATIPSYLMHAFSLNLNFLYKPNFLSVNQIKLNAEKATLRGDVTAENWSAETEMKLTFDLRSPDAYALASLVGVSLPSSFGPFKIVGTTDRGLKDMGIAATITALNATTSVQGSLSVQDKTIRPVLRVKSTGQNLSTTLQPLDFGTSSKTFGKFSLDALLSGDFPQRLKVKIDEASLALNQDKIATTGDIDLFLGRVKPKIQAKLTMESLNLDRLLAFMNGQDLSTVSASSKPRGKGIPTVKTPEKPKSKWSHERIDLSGLQSFDGDIDIHIPQVRKGALVFDGVKAVTRIANGVMDITDLSGGLYGGKLKMKARVSSQKEQPITLTAQLNNAELKNIAPSGATIKVLKGDFSLDADLTTSGQSEYQYVSNLSGALNFRGTEGQVSGFNLERVINNLDNVNDVGDILRVLDAAFSGGTTDFNAITAVSVINKGNVKLTKFDLVAPRAKVTASGSVSLPAYAMNVEALVNLDVKNLPNFKVLFSGPLDNPGHTIMADALKAYLMQNVVTGVISNIQRGDKSPESIIKGILGLEKDPQNKPTNESTESAPARETQKNQQQNTRREIRPEKQIEKAVEGLLNNLF